MKHYEIYVEYSEGNYSIFVSSELEGEELGQKVEEFLKKNHGFNPEEEKFYIDEVKPIVIK